MKFFIAFLTLTLFSVSSYSYQIVSKIRLQAETENLEKYLEITCNPNSENFCSELCNSNNKCEILETICEDCGSSNSQISKMIFTGDIPLFKTDIMFVEQQTLLGFFKKRKFMSIPYNLFINRLTPENKPKIKSEFEKLCQIKVSQGTLLASIDEENKIQGLVGIICDDTKGSVVLPINQSPDYSKKYSNFWESLNEEINVRLDELKLKMSSNLESRMQLSSSEVASTDLAVPSNLLSSNLSVSDDYNVNSKTFNPQIQNVQALPVKPLANVSVDLAQIPARITIPTAQFTPTPATLTVSAQAMIPTYVEPAVDTKLDICKKSAFQSDGTNSTMDDEYYEKCIRPQARAKRR